MRFVLLMLLCTFLLWGGEDKSGLKPEAESDIGLSIIVRGGVSLGAYEAGYNWALIRAFSKIREMQLPFHVRLRSVAGASAGSINALLTGMYWCQRPDREEKNHIEDNLFFDTWVGLGLEDLLVRPDNTENKSSLFSRRVLKKKAKAIVKHLQLPIYRQQCEVPLGIAVTKVRPIVEEFQGIDIEHQAFLIALTLQSEKGRLGFENRKVDTDLDLNFLEVPGIEKDPIKIEKVLFASSAFPGVFEQVMMAYRFKGKRGKGYFIDGGIYNNSPLNVAVALDNRTSHYFFLEPDKLRKQVRRKREKEKPPVGFLNGNLAPLAEAADIYQKMFLYQAINRFFRKHPERHLILSSRWHPLTAGFLEHFGAFIDRNFRLYDYHVGVYDALYRFASALRKKSHFSTLSQKEMMWFLAEKIGIRKNPEALKAFRFFLATEFHEKRIDRKNRYAAIYYAFRRDVPPEERYSMDNFNYFLTHLDLRHLPLRKGSFLAYMVKNPKEWYRRPLRYIINRITTLENDYAEVDPSYRPIADLFNIVAWAGSSLVRDKEGLEVQPLNVPREKRHATMRKFLMLLPKEVAIDSVNGGVSLAYEASYYADIGWIDGFQLRGSYNVQDRKNGGDYLRLDADLFHQQNEAISYGFGVSAFGNIERPFWDRQSGYGANLYVDFIEKLRATYVWRHGKGGNKHSLFFGVEDLPSLFYWLNR